MKTSAAGLALIQQFEGYVGHMYCDAVGIPTIGYGHVIGADETPLRTAILSQSAATSLLQRDLVRYEAAVTTNVAAPLTQHQFDALVSFTYNCGPAALAKSSLLKWVNLGTTDKGTITRAFGLWNRAGGKVLDALVKRRAKEAALFLLP